MPANDWAVTAYFIFLAALSGAAGGSFINCLSWRMVRGESVTKGRSRCTCCGHVLGAPDLVPVFSWLVLRGRCRYCGAGIPARYVGTELLMAAVASGLLVRYGLTLLTPYYLVYALILLGISLTDWETYEISDRFHAAAILWWFGGYMIRPVRFGTCVLHGLAGGAAISGALFLISLVFDRILGRESLGGGDIKLFFVTGLYLGLAVNLLNVIVSCVFALVLAGVTAKARSKKEDPEAIPFGPAIAASTLFCLMWGEQTVRWYLGFFGL